MTTRFAGLIAAAGQSSRMGTPKSLLRFDATDVFVSRVARAFIDGGVTSLYVTVPPDAEVAGGIRRALDERGLGHVVTLENLAYAKGLVGSLDTVVQALATAPAVAGLLFTPTDAPFVRAAHVTALIAAIGRGAPAARMTVNGRAAHPAAIGAQRFAGVASAASPRELLAHGVVDVDTDDVRMHAELNTPADYARLFSGA